MIFHKGKAARPQYVVIGSLDSPVKVGHAKLVVVDGAVAHTERSPWWESALL